jgi:hypothetical protein
MQGTSSALSGETTESFKEAWTRLVSNPTWLATKSWYDAFAATSAGLVVRRNLDRELQRSEVREGIWIDFFRDLVLDQGSRTDPFGAIDRIMRADHEKKRYFLPGMPLSEQASFLYRYVRLERLNEESFGFVLGGDETIKRLAIEIREGRCTAVHRRVKCWGAKIGAFG